MKTTLIVIQNDVDHAEAKQLVMRLISSSDEADRARMVAQARLVEAYEQSRWPRAAVSVAELLTYVLEQHELVRADLIPWCSCRRPNTRYPCLARTRCPARRRVSGR